MADSNHFSSKMVANKVHLFDKMVVNGMSLPENMILVELGFCNRAGAWDTVVDIWWGETSLSVHSGKTEAGVMLVSTWLAASSKMAVNGSTTRCPISLGSQVVGHQERSVADATTHGAPLSPISACSMQVPQLQGAEWYQHTPDSLGCVWYQIELVGFCYASFFATHAAFLRASRHWSSCGFSLAPTLDTCLPPEFLRLCISWCLTVVV